MSIFSNRINATCPTCGALTHQLAINTVAYKLAGCPECLSTIDITDDAATKALPPKIQEMKKATKTCPNCNAAISDYNKDIVYGKDGVIGCSACIRVYDIDASGIRPVEDRHMCPVCGQGCHTVYHFAGDCSRAIGCDVCLPTHEAVDAKAYTMRGHLLGGFFRRDDDDKEWDWDCVFDFHQLHDDTLFLTFKKLVDGQVSTNG